MFMLLTLLGSSKEKIRVAARDPPLGAVGAGRVGHVGR